MQRIARANILSHSGHNSVYTLWSGHRRRFAILLFWPAGAYRLVTLTDVQVISIRRNDFANERRSHSFKWEATAIYMSMWFFYSGQTGRGVINERLWLRGYN